MVRMKICYTSNIISFILFFILAPQLASASEYLLPCDAGSRLDGSLAFDICGSGSMINVTQQFKNISYLKAPFTPNSASINNSGIGGYINTQVSVNSNGQEQCNMLWFRIDNTTQGIIESLGGQTLGFGFSHGDYSSCPRNGSLSVFNSDGGGGKLYCNFSVNVNASQWYTLMMYARYSGTMAGNSRTNVTAWLNGNFWFNISNWFNNYFSATTARVEIGGMSTGTNNAIIGQLDHFISVNSTCNSSMIADYNSYFLTSSNILALQLRNLSLSSINFSTINIEKTFFVIANYTDSGGSSITTASCNASMSNVSAYFSFSSANASIDSSKFVNFTISESNNSVINDSLKFRICKNDAFGDIQILVNGSVEKTISNSVIPLCSIGFHEENLVIAKSLSSSNINISLSCSGCILLNAFTLITNSSSSKIFEFWRELQFHNESLVYNSSNSVYEFKNHLYNFKKSGVGISEINLICNGDDSNNSVNVSNLNSTSRIISINNIAYTNNMSVESNFSTSIIIDAVGSVRGLSFNVTYSNGSLIFNTTGEFMNLTNLQLNKNGIYNITIFVIDNNGGTSSTIGSFRINDTIMPIIIWNSPSFDNLTKFELNKTYFLSLNFYDVNLFSYEIHVFDSTNTLRYNYTVLNLNYSNVSFIQAFTPDLPTIWRVNVTISDDHTSAIIENFSYTISKENVVDIEFVKEFEREEIKNNVSIQYTGIYDSTLIIKKGVDRYNVILKSHLDSAKFLKSVTQNFVVSCDGIILRPNSRYTAHFVCPESHVWVDFQNSAVVKWNAKRKTPKSYDVILETIPVETLEFSSIGKLNIISEQTTFEVIPTPITKIGLFNFDLNNFNNLMLLLILVILYLGTAIISFAHKSFAFGSISFFTGLIIGFMFLNLSIIVSLAMWLLNTAIFMSIAHFQN